MKSLFIGFSLFFVTLTSSAASFINVRAEEARMIVEIVEESQDGWPEIRARYTYPTKEEAQVKEAELKTSIIDLVDQRTFFKPQMAATQLWVSKNAWSQEWEQKYSDWIEVEVDRSFFVKYNIPTDCADVAYALRWIFSRMSGLPMASKLGSLNTLMTNLTVRPEWAKLPTAEVWHQDQRFMAALNYVTNMTYTHTLWDDSFPVALDRSYFLSGTYHLAIHDTSGHTQVVRWLGQGEQFPFLTMNSTVPRAVRTLSETIYSESKPKQKESAFLRFRWAVQTSNGITLKKPTEMPGYSLEQFSFGEEDGNYIERLFEKLGYKGGKEGITQFLLKDLIEQFEIRKEIVTNGFEKCQTISCEPGTSGWEDWSTPSRDARILSKVDLLDEMLDGEGGGYGTEFDNTVIVDYEQQPWTGKSIIWNWKNSVIDSDPRVLPLHRWGAGYESWLKKQIEYLATQLRDRLNHLEKARAICEKQNCQLGTSNFNILGSHVMDQNIRQRVNYLLDMDKFLPKRVIDLLSNALNQEVFSIKNQSIHLDFLLKKDLLLNASPSADFDSQWGLNKKRSLYRHTEKYGSYPYFKKWTINETDNEVFLIENEESLLVPGRIILSFKNNPVLLLRTQDGYSLFHLETNKNFMLPNQFAGYLLASSAQDRIIAKNSNETVLFKLSQNLDSLEFEKKFEGSHEFIFGNELMRIDNKIYDVDKSRFYDVEWKSDLNMIIHPQFIVYSIDWSDKSLIINRSTGRIDAIPYLPVDAITVRGRQILRPQLANGADSTRIVLFNSDFQVVYDKELSGFCDSYYENYFQCYESRGSISYERVENNIVVFKPNERISWLNESYYTKLDTVGNDFVMSLYEKKSNRLILKANRIFQVSSSIVGVRTHEEGSIHLVDLKSLEPIYTNIIKHSYMQSEEIQGGYLISNYSGWRHNLFVMIED